MIQPSRSSPHPSACLRAGFTVLEVVIATAFVSLALGAIGLVQMRIGYTVAQEQAELLCGRALERVTQQLEGTGHIRFVPDLPENAVVSTITFQRSMGGSSAGIAGWGAPSMLALQLAPGETKNGLDDDKDGLIDEDRLVLTRGLGTPHPVSTLLCSGISKHGLDEQDMPAGPGFSVRRLGHVLTVRLSVDVPYGTGQTASATRQVSVALND